MRRILLVLVGLALVVVALNVLSVETQPTPAAAVGSGTDIPTTVGVPVELRGPHIETSVASLIEPVVVLERNVIEGSSSSARAAPLPDDAARLEVRIVGGEAHPDGERPRVSVSHRGRAEMETWQETDALGHVSFEVEAGVALHVAVEPSRGAGDILVRDLQPLVEGDHHVLTIELSPQERLTFWGRAIDERGRPVAEAQVWLGELHDLLWTATDTTAPPARAHQVAVSDANGSFEVLGVVSGLQALRVESPDRAWTLTPFLSGHEESRLARDILLRGTASLTVFADPAVVTDGPATSAIQVERHISLPIVPHDLRTFGSARWREALGPNGSVRFVGLPTNEALRVDLLQDDRPIPLPDIELRLAPGEQRVLDLRQAATARLSGSLRDPQGVPQAGVEIWLECRTDDRVQPFLGGGFMPPDRRCVTDVAGEFAFDDVHDGEWWIGASPESACPADRFALQVKSGSPDRDLDLVLSCGLYISGRVRSWNSNGISEGRVHATFFGARAAYSCELDPLGAFRVGPMPPGRYRVVASPAGANSEDCALAVVEDVPAGSQDVELVCPPAGILEVRVAGGFDGAMERLEYLLTHRVESGQSFPADSGRSDSSGAFKITNLGQAEYDLFAWTSLGRVAVVTGIRNEPGIQHAPLTLALVEGGRIRVRVTGVPRIRSVSVARGGTLLRTEVSSAGDPLELVVPSGPLVVEASWSADGERRRHSRGVLVPAGGDPVEVVFDELR